MGYETGIQWCDHSWNPWRGCTKVSEGCANCYAEALSTRNPGSLGIWGDRGQRAIGAVAYWNLPLRWNREAAEAEERRRVFTLSLGDWLELRGDLDAPRGHLLGTIARTPWLDWLLLTKRPQDFREAIFRAGNFAAIAGDSAAVALAADWLNGSPPANVWAGASAENQRRFEERHGLLMAIPAVLHFISAEPLLGPIVVPCLGGLEWIIIGGESGPGARPCEVRWIQRLVSHCRRLNLACYVKQLGSNVEAPCHESYHPWDDFDGMPILTPGASRPDLNARVRLKHPKGGDPSEWPPGLRVREFPR